MVKSEKLKACSKQVCSASYSLYFVTVVKGQHINELVWQALKGQERGRERGYLGTRECNGRVRRRLISPHPTPLMLSHAQIAPSPFKACQVDYTLICYKNLYLHGP